MTTSIRWGILSTARIAGKRLVPAMHNAHNSEVVAVASRNQEKAQAFATEHNIPTAYGSYEALLNAPNVDAIYIPLPNNLHAEWSIQCAEAGKPTLCEKPLAIDAAQAQQMVDAFAERNVLFAEAFMYRFHPQHARVQEIITSGGIGDMQMIKATFSFPVNNPANIRLQPALAGGSLMDVGCYCVNAMRFMTGEEPVQAQAFAHFGPDQAGFKGVDETLTGLLRFPSGVMGHFDSSLRLYRTEQYEVRGTEGRVLVETAFVPDLTPGAMTVVHHWRGNDDAYQRIEVPTQDQYQLLVEDFAEALLTGRQVRYPIQDAVNNMRALDMLYAAARANTLN